MINQRTILIRVVFLILCAFLLSSCNLPDSGGGTPDPCSVDFLVMSINDANVNGPAVDTIELDPGCIYQLGTVDNTVDGNNGLPSITTSIVINGNGATVRRSTGAQKAAIRLFHVSPGGELVLNNLILLDGLGMEPPDVTDPVRNSGGAVYNAGTLTVNSAQFVANRAKLKGGAIFNAGAMNVVDTTFENNGTNIGDEPGESGGAIYNTGTASLTGCTLVGNTASQAGAGIANTGTLTVTNSTVSGNSTTLSEIASGAALMNSGTAEITYTTIAENIGTTSGAVFSAPDTIQIRNSIVADNAPADCSYPASSAILEANLDSDGSCDGFTITDDPQLGSLADNGGPTRTHSLAPSSPAKNAATGSCPASDQRGEPRPHGSACDLGAYEITGGPPPGDSSILEGLVFDDQNADGVHDPGEPGLAGVEVLLGDGGCPAAGSSAAALTAADGSYQVEIPPPSGGSYCLSIDPLTPPNDTILIPGEFTDPPDGQLSLTLGDGEDLADQQFAWDFQFTGGQGANLVITNVYLSSQNISVDDWVEVEVTVENQGSAAASGYELVLIPHYGVGPPNPAGFQPLPELDPGNSHTVTFSPGVLYATAGEHTLRVLVTDDWLDLGNPDSTGTAGDYQDFTITVSGPNLVITGVDLASTTLFSDQFMEVEVTVENQGSAPASGHDGVLIPHYGVGPPNPAGYVNLPDMAAGASHTWTFSPGVIYPSSGTYTLRVLVTDDWLDLGDPNSTGTAGDYYEREITVLSHCGLFKKLELKVVLLKVDPETLVFPIYFRFPEEVPVPAEGEIWEYQASLGQYPSYRCELQGYEDRLYCLFQLPESALGEMVDLTLGLESCEDPVFIQKNVIIPELELVCTRDLKEKDCIAAGGKMSSGATTAPYCICP